jgi:hypothetical protein
MCIACLQEMGKMSYAESVTLLVLLIALAFWVSGGYIKPTPINTMAVAFMALSLLLLTGVLSWEDCLACTFAWDTLFWITILMVSWQGVLCEVLVTQFVTCYTENQCFNALVHHLTCSCALVQRHVVLSCANA